jgi:hypothetical protein
MQWRMMSLRLSPHTERDWREALEGHINTVVRIMQSAAWCLLACLCTVSNSWLHTGTSKPGSA